MFKQSMEMLKKTKNLAILGILIAMKIVVNASYIPLSESLRIKFVFLFNAVEGAIFGPAGALISGFLTDIIAYMINPAGAFFIGYTISTMLRGLVWALGLYQKKITVVRLVICKIINNVFISAILSSVWTTMLYSKGYIYYVTSSLIKNITLLPFEIILLVLFMNMMLPILNRYHLIAPQEGKIPLK
ncbi:MAG: folate family ECF transporter S component [Erysipelotrichaceae bacterium]|nr:folate family ECF transporter S component [Erysipelotrichaceae bacterium]